jgi:GTPase SAR1 family protein
MAETKKILLIGRSGRGKSTLANVIAGMENKFKESGGSASETKKIQFEEFKDEDINYLVIDTPGIGDTKMSDNEVLDIIAEAIYLVRDGLSQVLFVIDGRFDQYEMVTYNLLRTIIFDECITKHTTIIRTCFGEFRDKKECNADINSMIKEAKKTKKRLEQDIIAKEKELTTLKKGKETELNQLISSVEDKLKSSNFLDLKRKERNEKLEIFFKNFPADQDKFIKDLENIKQGLSKKLTQGEINNLYQVRIELNNLQVKLDDPFPDGAKELLTGIEKAKKELAVTNLAEIIESCQEKVVHVNNPPTEIAGADEDELRLNKRKRTESRKIVLGHLKDSCQEKKDAYKPPKLQELSTEITDYMESKLKLEEELRKLKNNEQSSTINQPLKFEESKNKLENISEEISKDESSIEKEKKSIEDNQEITTRNDNLAIGKIKELENKKARLKKEILEKEKIIRQKVLKHIFNNYKEISSELGGDILMESVVDEHKWENISPEFKDKELVLKWLNEEFDYEQIEKWAIALGDNFKPKEDAGFCAWLRDNRGLVAEKVKELDYPRDIEELRKQYAQQLEKETEMLDKHKKIIEIPDKHKKDNMKNQEITTRNDNLAIGKIKELENPDKHKKDNMKNVLIKRKGYTQLEQEKEKSQAQKWLDEHYPIEKRKKTTELDISSKNLTGSLDFSDFFKLKELNCRDNKLTELILENNFYLDHLLCCNNQLTNINFLTKLNSKSLTWLDIRNNNIFSQDLSIFATFINLEFLYIGKTAYIIKKKDQEENYCNIFYGSLEPLKNLVKLKSLSISNTDIDSGLECLPRNLKKIYCDVDNEESKSQKISKELSAYLKKDKAKNPYYDYQAWRKDSIEKVRNEDPEKFKKGNQYLKTQIEQSSKTKV